MGQQMIPGICWKIHSEICRKSDRIWSHMGSQMHPGSIKNRQKIEPQRVQSDFGCQGGPQVDFGTNFGAIFDDFAAQMVPRSMAI